MNEVRRFKLVFLLRAPDPCEARRELLEAIESATAKGLLDFLDSPPTIRIAVRPPEDERKPFDFD